MNREPRRPVAVEEVAAFQRDGVVLLRGLLDEAWIELLADAIERDIADPGPGFHGYASEDGGRFHGNFDLWRTGAEFARY